MESKRLLPYSIILIFFVQFSVFPVSAQKVGLSQFAKWKPRNLGPSGMSGRITAIDAVVDDPKTVYLGAASGVSGKPLMEERPGPQYLTNSPS